MNFNLFLGKTTETPRTFLVFFRVGEPESGHNYNILEQNWPKTK